MKYLVLAVFSDGCNVATHSKEIELEDEHPQNCEAKIIDSIAESGLGKTNLWEVFVFKSNQFGVAPSQIAYWNQEDGLFGDEESEDEDD